MAQGSGSGGETRAAASAASPADVGGRPPIDPEMASKIAALRDGFLNAFAKVVLSLSATARYRHLSLGDLEAFVIEPLMRDRIAIATVSPPPATAIEGEVGGAAAGQAVAAGPLAGIAIWAKVSEAVDARIREQIAAGVFPVRLKPDDWSSGEIVWLLDVVAPSRQLTAAVMVQLQETTSLKQMPPRCPEWVRPVLSA